MQLQSILNRVEKHTSFVYGRARWVETGQPERLGIEVEVRPRKNGRPRCSGCHKRRPGYDRLPPRRFEFVPLWNIVIFLVYSMRRVGCPRCGVVVEEVPWAQGKHPQTTSLRWFLARWAKRLSWQEVARAFGTTWEAVYSAVLMAVVFGLEHRSLCGIEAIGVDEIAWQKGHKYLTLVYEIGEGTKRLLYIGKERTEESLRTFFQLLGRKSCAALRYICSDMWQPYLTVIAQMAKRAIQILDRFHIMKKFNEAIDEVRREEARRMKQQGYEPVLRHARWCLLKRPENLTKGQATKLAELLGYNLRSVRAYLLREEFQRFWEYLRPSWAGQFLDDWCTRAMRSKLEPIKKVVGMLRSHRDLLLNWFKAKGAISSGAVEGMNNNAKVVMRKAYGFRTFRAVEVALYHTLGELPEPNFTHEFC
jgi:transposase